MKMNKQGPNKQSEILNDYMKIYGVGLGGPNGNNNGNNNNLKNKYSQNNLKMK